jgi:outer membrane protein OmpA-like peptidoglycan-associated protein
MRKIASFLVVLFSALVVFSQKTELTKRPSLGINFFFKDFVTPDLIGKNGLPVVLRDGTWNKIVNMSPGMSVSYYQGLNDHLDFMANLHGTFVNYPFFNGSKIGSDKFLLESDANVNLKLLTDKYFMVPYLSAGVGAGMVGGTYFYAYAPVGTGFQFNLGEGSFINLQWSYHLRVSDYSNYNFHYSLGFSSPLTEKKAPVVLATPPPPPPPPPPADTDKDGITDDKDKCPTVPGVAKYDGCPVPDTDKDGINDENDKCPTVPGLAKYQGCPIPDTDGDGINDEEDKCPTVPGVARYQGCPIPDTDGDGVNDEEDKCPTEKGLASNFGCPDFTPALKEAAKSIYFTSGTAKFAVPKRALSKLDTAISILVAHPNMKMTIEGHTDNSGNDKINKPLSQKRAETILQALIGKGISKDRLTAIGYGSEKPVDTNKTPQGKANNRRVELVPTFDK